MYSYAYFAHDAYFQAYFADYYDHNYAYYSAYYSYIKNDVFNNPMYLIIQCINTPTVLWSVLC